MSSQNLLLSLSGAVDDLAELVARAEREIDAETYRSVVANASRLSAELRQCVLRARRVIHHYELGRALQTPAHPPAAVVDLATWRERRAAPGRVR